MLEMQIELYNFSWIFNVDYFLTLTAIKVTVFVSSCEYDYSWNRAILNILLLNKNKQNNFTLDILV